jgi:hypothetical protein
MIFISRMAPIYMLKLNKSSIPNRPQLSYYAQGMDAQCISFSNITHWSIIKVVIISGKAVSFSLNRHFIALQRLMKLYSRFLLSLRSLRVLRLRELGGKIPRWRAPPRGALHALALAPPTGGLYTVG